ncbi:hypothetical protein IC582_011949 [Cucumis melo]
MDWKLLHNESNDETDHPEPSSKALDVYQWRLHSIPPPSLSTPKQTIEHPHPLSSILTLHPPPPPFPLHSTTNIKNETHLSHTLSHTLNPYSLLNPHPPYPTPTPPRLSPPSPATSKILSVSAHSSCTSPSSAANPLYSPIAEPH